MLGRFIESNGFKRIPNTGNVFALDIKGNIRNNINGEHLACKENAFGEPIVTGAVGEWFDGVKLSVLMGIVFRNVVCHPVFWSRFDVLYKDGNPKNFKLRNTVWKCPQGDLELPYLPGFCVVPGLSRYLVSRDGQVWSTTKCDYLSPYQDDNGYWMFGVQPDVGSRTIIGQHRIMCLAYLNYPATVDKLDVNHLDGTTSNNWLENFEWATRTRNNLHAAEKGLNKTATKVVVRSVRTGTTKSFFSIEECARQLGLDSETIRLRLKTRGQVTYPPGYQFKRVDENLPWKEEINLVNASTGVGIKVTSLKTGNHITFNSAGKTAEFFSTSTAGVLWHLNKHGSDKPYHGYILERLDPMVDTDSPLTW